MNMTYNGVTVPITSVSFEDNVFTVTTTETITLPITGEVEIEAEDCTYYFDTLIYSDIDITAENGTTEMTFAYADRIAQLEAQIFDLQLQIDELSGWTTYATGETGHGSVANTGCDKSGRVVSITQTETPPTDAQKRFVIRNYRATGFVSQYHGDVIIPMDKATLCQGIRPGFWDGDIYIEVGGVGAQMIYGAEGDGSSTYTIDFDSITAQYKGGTT